MKKLFLAILLISSPLAYAIEPIIDKSTLPVDEKAFIDVISRFNKDEILKALGEPSYKEDIKIGYNLKRKIVLLTICAMIPVLAYWMPQYLSWAVPAAYEDTPVRITGMLWLFLGIGGLLFRVFQLWHQQTLQL